MKISKLILALALMCAFAHAQKLNLATETQGVLPGSAGGRGNTSPGVFGQVLIGDGAGHFAPGDPIVSFNYANLLTTQPATGTSVGTAARLSTFGAAGSLYVTFASITGSGTSCTIQLKNYDSLGNAINNGSAISVTPANGVTTFAVSPALALQTAAQMSATYSCSAYPSAGTISVDFVPAVSVGIAGQIAIANFPAGFSISNFPATQPISAVSLPLPTGAATSANQPTLVGGRTPVDPSGVTSPISAVSLPLPAGAAQDATLTGGTTKAINRGGAKGSTTAADVTSTASGANHQALDVAQYDASGNQLGLSASPVRTDPTGTTPQPASQSGTWTNTVTQATGTNLHAVLDTTSTTAVTQATASNLNAQVQGAAASGAAKAGNPVQTGLVFNTTQPTVTTGQAVETQGTARGAAIVATGTDTFNATINAALPAGSNTIGNVKLTDGTNTQAVKAASTAAVAADPSAVVAISPNSNTVALISGTQVKPTDGTNIITVKAASTQAAATDTSQVFQLNPNQPQLTTPLNTQGAKTNNNAAPGATNVGTLPSLANAAPPTNTEGNQVSLSIDLKGNLRVNNHPPDVLGCYMVNGRTGTYGGQAALSPLFSYRWGDATHFAVIQSVKINVATTTAATAATQAERELIIARSFTASDTGGTSVTMTGNNQKMRTSQATSLVTNIQFGAPLTAGTRTLDANPISSVVSFLATNMTGMDIGCGSGGPFVSGTAWTCVGGLGMVPLLDVATGDYPIVLAQNEGIIVRIGKDAQPTSAVQQTYVSVKWCEVNAFIWSSATYLLHPQSCRYIN